MEQSVLCQKTTRLSELPDNLHSLIFAPESL